VARLNVALRAAAELDHLIVAYSLPDDTRDRVRRVLRPLADFPLMGALLERPGPPYRFLLGPWRWMLLIYLYDEERDVVVVIGVEDARSSTLCR
jgi:plasmid stabilization system protein ParE